MFKKLKGRITTMTIAMWVMGILITFAIIYGSAVTLIAGKYTGRQWVEFTVFGLAQGGIYALIALGYTQVYGILKMINFAHSEVFMSGPMIGFFAARDLYKWGFLDAHPILSLLIVLVVAMTVSMTVAVLLELIAYRPLRGAPRLVPLITAIGASFFLQYFFKGLFGSNVKVYPDWKILSGKWTILGAHILKVQVVVFVAAILLMVALYSFMQNTKIGKAIRAVSEDKDAAALMGIDVDQMISFSFALGGIMAGAGGVFYALIYKQVFFLMGFVPGIKAFTAAVLGGIGNVPGAMLGGFFLGIFEALGPNLFLDGLGIPAPYQLKDVIAFSVLVLVLIFRPTGILGERLAKRA
jgi:branched-chain amino acid transport system permease protein